MCEHDDLHQFAQRSGKFSRRQFGAMALGAGVAGLLPDTASAGINGKNVVIKTPDGSCDAWFVAPATGKHPGVLIWPDIFGLRPAFQDMANRLAEAGYAVLVVNPFYRLGPAPTAPANADFNDPETRKTLMGMMGTLNADTARTDSKAFVAFLDAQPQVDTKKKLGATGYCMGGPLVFRSAGFQSARIGAAATFHGGGLVTDKPDSPHLLIPQMKAQFLVAVAQNDDAKQPEAKTVLKEAFDKAKLPAEIEVYAAQHGWCPTDSHVYDHELAEKAWARMLALFGKALT